MQILKAPCLAYYFKLCTLSTEDIFLILRFRVIQGCIKDIAFPTLSLTSIIRPNLQHVDHDLLILAKEYFPFSDKVILYQDDIITALKILNQLG